jgi:hypothetical protein
MRAEWNILNTFTRFSEQIEVGYIVDLFTAIHLALSFSFFVLLYVAAAVYINKKEYGLLTTIGRWILYSQRREMCVLEASYLYVLFSLMFWIMAFDTSGGGFVAAVGIGGAIAIPGDIYLRRHEGK